jgi:hypothetical protein
MPAVVGDVPGVILIEWLVVKGEFEKGVAAPGVAEIIRWAMGLVSGAVVMLTCNEQGRILSFCNIRRAPFRNGMYQYA